MKAFLSACFLVCVGLISSAQDMPPALPGLRHFGPEHGLPSAECHDLLYDNLGLLWIATDNGICSFDGSRFRSYGPREGLSDPVVLHMALNDKGEILCLSLHYRLFVFRKGRFEPHPREFILQNKVAPGDIPQGLLIGEEGQIYIGTSRSGLLCIEGEDDEPGQDNYRGMSLCCSPSGCIAGSGISGPEVADGSSVRIVPSGQILPLPASLADKLPLRSTVGGDYRMLSAGTQLLRLTAENTVEEFLSLPEKIQALHGEESGKLWIGTSEGLYRFSGTENLRNAPPTKAMSGLSVSCLLPAPETGSMWIASAGQGLFLLPHSDAIAIEERNSEFVSMESDAVGLIYLLDSKGTVSLWNPDLPGARPVPIAREILAICSSAEGAVIALSAKPSEGSHQLNIISNPVLATSGVLGASHSPVTGEVMVPCRKGFHILSATNGELLYSSSQNQFHERCYDVQRDSNRRLWAATSSGLYSKNQEGFKEAAPDPSDKARTVVSDMEILADGSLMFLEKGQGVWMDGGKQLEVSPAYHGINASYYRKIKIQRDGSLLLIGVAGVAKCSLSGNSLRVLAFADASDGLAAGEICDAGMIGEKLAVLTRHGITVLPTLHGVGVPKTPVYAGVYRSDSTATEFQENDICGPFNFICPEFLRPQSLRFRFRLNPDSPWMENPGTEIAFPVLPGGCYQLEVSASVAPGLWSEGAVLPFRVALPYWKTWWLLVLCAGAIIAGVYLFLRYTIIRLRRSDIIEKKLIHLERSALLAQMNPHFIFNSLNSIQSYIALNENDKANRFLAKFARLIRAMLNHSRAQKISLHEEIESLKLYLELEKMRFKDKFDFEITVDKDIDTMEVELPPLLIQPYLENAIIHGLARKEGVGRVELLYLKIGQYLIATVTDNGIGIEAAKKMKDKPDSLHKSVGMTITQKRLELLDEGNSDKKVTIEEVKDRFGKVLGTKVEVKIKL